MSSRATRTPPAVVLTALLALIPSTVAGADGAGRGRQDRRANDPRVAFASPPAGATLSGVVTISGRARAEAGIRRVRYRVDDGPARRADGRASWSFDLDTTAYTNGRHKLMVRVFDRAGRSRAAVRRVRFVNGTLPQPEPPPSAIDGEGTIVGMASNESPNAVAAIEQALGASFLGVRRNASLAYPVPLSSDLGDQASGRFVYRNANAEDVNRPMFGGWAAIAAGSADAYLAASIPYIRDHFTPDRPYLFSFHHEQAMANENQCGIGCNGDAVAYRAAFVHVVEYFRAAGVADRMRFVLTPVIGQYLDPNDPVDGIRAIDPGPAYVDIYGVDVYTRAQPDGTLTKPHPPLGVVSSYAASRGRPYLIGEWGVASEVRAGAGYWREAVAQIVRHGRSGPGSCYAILTDVASLSSEANLQAVREAMVGNPQFRWL